MIWALGGGADEGVWVTDGDGRPPRRPGARRASGATGEGGLEHEAGAAGARASGRSATRDGPVHGRGQRWTTARPRPAPPWRVASEASTWPNSSKMRARASSGHAGAGVVDDEGQASARVVGAAGALDRDADAAGVGELHRVAGEVEQDLTQPAFVGEDVGRVGGDRPDDLQPLVVGAGAEQFGDAAHQAFQIDGRRVELQLAGLQPGVVEQVVDQAQQVFGRVARGLGIGALGAVQPGAGQAGRACR